MSPDPSISAEVTFELTGYDECGDGEISLGQGLNGEEVWRIGPISLAVPDAISQKFAAELAFTWLKVADKVSPDMTAQEFWDWLETAADEKLTRDQGVYERTPTASLNQVGR